MKKLIPFFTLLFLLGNTSLNAQLNRDVMQIKTDVVYLASDYCEGRETGTRGETIAAEYIAHRFREIGLIPKGGEGSWFQEFPFKELVNPHSTNPKDAKEGMGKNVVAFLNKGSDKTIVIGAHYDHLGMGGSGSLDAGEPAIHNGADDNASGIAALLKIAKYVATVDYPFQNNFLFIAFSGEEKGLFGSKYYAENPTIDIKSVNFMFNMDMVGMLNKEKSLAVYGTGTSPIWKEIIEATPNDFKITTAESGVGPSDHTSFYLKNIPVLHFFSGQHKHYHKPTDDSDKVNFGGIAEISNYMIELIIRLDKKDKLDFTKTKDEDTRKAAAFKVTLGVMPDYVYQGKGMRIDSVLGGRVGDKAGLEDGDIVIKIGDIEVDDIYKYMEGLSKFKKGDKAKVTVLRGKKMKKVTKEVTF